MSEDPSRRKKAVGPTYTSSRAWKVTSTVGGRFPNINPIFTPDKNHFIVLTSLELRVYSKTTKQIVRSIPVDQINEVTDLQLCEQSTSFVVIARSTGKYELVNWLDKNAEKIVIDVKFPIHKIISRSDSELVIYSEKHGIVSLTKNVESGEWEGLTPIIQIKGAKTFAISASKKYIAFYSSTKSGETISVGKLDKSYKLVSEKVIKRTRAISSIAISDKGILAVGSVTGVIDLYYDIFGTSGEPLVRALKWHVDSVLSLSFSLNDDYLLSGGKERVLVFWQLETDNTQFLPRLEGDITDIYVDPNSQLYALSLQGDQLVILSSIDLASRFQVSGIKAVFSKVPGDPEKERKRRRNKDWDQINVADYTTAYYINPQTKHAYFPTRNGSQIQVYDTTRDQQLTVFSAASAIQTGKVRSESVIEDPIVTHVVFTADGNWMATIDVRTSPVIDRLLSKDDKEINLKFWSRNQKSNEVRWDLATRVSAPHGLNKSIVDIIPTISGHGFITAAQDGGIRLWKPANVDEIASTARTVTWGVRRFLPPTAMTSTAVSVSSSSDGSVLVLGYESTLRLIDGVNFRAIRTLPNILGSRVRHVQIVGSKLVALSKTRLVVWDLLTNRQVWSIQVHSTTHGKRLLAIDTINETVALAVNFFARDFKVVSRLFIFRLDTPMPIHIESHPYAISALNHLTGTGNFSFMNVNGCISQLSSGTKAGLHRAGLAVIGSANSEENDFNSGLKSLYEAQKREAKIANPAGDDLNTTIHDQVLSIHSFDRVFDDALHITSLESLMEGVLSITSPRLLD
ncbi:Nan1p [Sugiyamaella lignohabitans]|uniref:Nan1p n=1 Tax=Sugiyamaella lignohabitans TaxID=796027 RepID=A0A167DV21_9ASCO|nr:Nan1p [Sugiyamaella lignohabitans]ANB13325.1 Nan1p [Sugiyamaella lignohabitans]